MNKVIQTLNKAYRVAYASAFLWAVQAHAAGGLARTKGALGDLKDEALIIIPIVAIIGLAAMGVGYSMKMVEKDTLVRGCGGIIFAGSAAEIVALLYG